MQAVRIHAYRVAPTLEDVPVPEVGPEDVLVRVGAAALNPLDGALQAGAMERVFPLTFPYTMGTDLAGTVEQVGASVTAWRAGDEVIARPSPATGGACAEFAAVPAGACVARPPAMAVTAAAGLPTAGGTAWKALFEVARLAAGQTVLIHAGAGGVGSFAVQFAHAVGARVFATASGDGLEIVRRLGADRAIDYTAEDFARVVADEGPAADVVLDTVGGETQARSFAVLRPGGHLVSTVSPPDQPTAVARGVSAEMVFLTRGGVPLQRVVDAVRDWSLHVLIDRTLPMARFGDALARQGSGRARGKIILTNT